MRRKLFPDPLAAAAYHEAGHAMMCRIMGFKLQSISIIADELVSGQTTHEKSMRSAKAKIEDTDRARSTMEKTIMVCLAGPSAQKKYALNNLADDHGGAIDADTAFDLALRLFRSKRTAAAYIKFAEEWVRQKLEEPTTWAAVEALARALVEQRKLSGRQAESILRGAMHGRAMPDRSGRAIGTVRGGCGASWG